MPCALLRYCCARLWQSDKSNNKYRHDEHFYINVSKYLIVKLHFLTVSSIRTLMLIQGRLELTETSLIHFKWVSV